MNATVDQVVGRVLMQCSDGEMGNVCRRFLDMFTPEDDGEDLYPEISSDVKTQKKEGGEKQSANNESCSQTKPHISFQPTKYPPTLLPMLIIK